jgi:hypothetical protein
MDNGGVLKASTLSSTCSPGLNKGAVVAEQECGAPKQPTQAAMWHLPESGSYASCVTHQPPSPPAHRPQGQGQADMTPFMSGLYSTAVSIEMADAPDVKSIPTAAAPAAAAAVGGSSRAAACRGPPSSDTLQQVEASTLPTSQSQRQLQPTAKHTTPSAGLDNDTSAKGECSEQLLTTNDRSSWATWASTLLSSRASNHIEAVKEASHLLHDGEADKVGNIVYRNWVTRGSQPRTEVLQPVCY